MPSIRLHPPSGVRSTIRNPTIPLTPLPLFLSTPLGLAILEIQGTLNLPTTTVHSPLDNPVTDRDFHDFPIGTLEFPLLDLTTAMRSNKSQGPDEEVVEARAGGTEGPWMKRVLLNIGGNQRLVGEVSRLDRPVGVLGRRRGDAQGAGGGSDENRDGYGCEEAEILDVVRWKLFFGGRPEFL